MPPKPPRRWSPKRWSLKRRKERDRGLRWKAFWMAIVFFFIALLWMAWEYAVQGLLALGMR